VIIQALDFLEHPNPTYPISRLCFDRGTFDNRFSGTKELSRGSVSCFLGLQDHTGETADHYHLVIDMKAQTTFLSIVASADEYVYQTWWSSLEQMLTAT
jgi:hypothetical protein